MIIPDQAVDIVKRFEGFRPKAYLCPAGVWTVGYGTTSAAGVAEVHAQTTVSEPEAELWLILTLSKFAKKIRPLIRCLMTSNEWAAMLSLAYNIGVNAFRRSSVLRHFNAGEKTRAADAFLLWKKAKGKVLKGLVVRREAERDLFLTASGQAIA